MLLLNEQEMCAAVTCEDIMETVEKAFLLFDKRECKMADLYTVQIPQRGKPIGGGLWAD